MNSQQFKKSFMRKFILIILIVSQGMLANSQVINDLKPDTISTIEFAYPFWSPDSKEFAFQSNFTGTWQLYIMNSETKAVTRITDNLFNDVTPAWSPDGTKILFTSDRDGDEEIFLMSLSDKSVKKLTDNTSRDIHPTWSPDGKKIIFNSAKEGDTTRKLIIQVMDVSGTNKKIIREDEYINSYASFSPDGNKIAFVKWMDKGKNGEIFIMNPDGTGEERLTNNIIFDGYPTWSTDGAQIIYSAPVNKQFKLFSLTVKTRDIKQLSFGDGFDARANCSKDQKKIIFNRGTSGRIDLLIIKAD